LQVLPNPDIKSVHGCKRKNESDRAINYYSITKQKLIGIDGAGKRRRRFNSKQFKVQSIGKMVLAREEDDSMLNNSRSMVLAREEDD
jgi:hypothetical protein